MTDDDNIVLRGMNNFQTREGRNDDEDDVFMQLIADARPGRVKQKKRREDSCNIFATATLRATQLAGFACRSDREDDETYFFLKSASSLPFSFFSFRSHTTTINACLWQQQKSWQQQQQEADQATQELKKKKKKSVSSTSSSA